MTDISGYPVMVGHVFFAYLEVSFSGFYLASIGLSLGKKGTKKIPKFKDRRDVAYFHPLEPPIRVSLGSRRPNPRPTGQPGRGELRDAGLGSICCMTGRPS